MGTTAGDLIRRQKDGQHDAGVIINAPLVEAIAQAVAGYIGNLFEPGLLELLRRFLVKGDRNDARSYVVGVEPPASGVAGRVMVLNANPARVEAIIYNNGTAPIYLGGRQVTVGGPNDPSGGIPVQPLTGFILSHNAGELYAVAGTAGQDVRVLETSGGV